MLSFQFAQEIVKTENQNLSNCLFSYVEISCIDAFTRQFNSSAPIGVLLCFAGDEVNDDDGSLHMLMYLREILREPSFSNVKLLFTLEKRADPLFNSIIKAPSRPTAILFDNGHKHSMVTGFDPDVLLDLKRDILILQNSERNKLRPWSPLMQCSNEELEEITISLMSTIPVLLIMKGSPTRPRCKYSRTAYILLSETIGKRFVTWNMLEYKKFRQTLVKMFPKVLFPCVFSYGFPIANGHDLQVLSEQGSLRERIQNAMKLNMSRDQAEVEQIFLNAAPNSSILILINGTPSDPLDHSSALLVNLINMTNLSYDSFDLSEDHALSLNLIGSLVPMGHFNEIEPQIFVKNVYRCSFESLLNVWRTRGIKGVVDYLS